MKRLFWSLILVGAVAGLYLLTPRVVTVVRGASQGTVTPSGEYGLAGFQIFTFPTFTFPVPTGINTGYCGITGTVHFFGGPNDPVGPAEKTATASFTLRCNGVVQLPNPQTGSATYRITGANEFDITLVGDPNGPLHGRTLDGGDVVLIDGTSRNTITTSSPYGSLIDYITLVRP